MIAAPWLGPPHPVTSARDALLGRLLLCVHPAVRRESHLAAVLVWALDADPALVARAIRRPASTVVWLVRCFERRVRAVWLVEGIPVGRSCADRVGALVELLTTPRADRGRGTARPRRRVKRSCFRFSQRSANSWWHTRWPAASLPISFGPISPLSVGRWGLTPTFPGGLPRGRPRRPDGSVTFLPHQTCRTDAISPSPCHCVAIGLATSVESVRTGFLASRPGDRLLH